MSTIQTISTSDTPAWTLITKFNANFSALNTDKAELSGATFTGDINVPDEAYGAGWNGSTEVPTKNAIYDKIETMWGNMAVSTYDPAGIAQQVLWTTATQTVTNKDLKSSTNTISENTTTASSATPAPTGWSLRNFFTITALATNPTFSAPSGTPANGNTLLVRVKDNGTARTLAWNAIYRAGNTALPTTTILGKTMYLLFIYNSADSKWDLLSVQDNL